MKITREQIQNAILSIIQPLYRGVFNGNKKLFSTLRDLVPFGTADNFQSASYFGIVSKPIAGTLGYFLNLNGKAQAPVLVTHLDLKRPEPTADGETVLYSLNADGSLTPVKVTLSNDGKLTVVASKMYFGSAASAEPLVLGTVAIAGLTALINSFLNASQIGQSAVGPVVLDPSVRTALTNFKTTYLDTASSNIVSQKSFTERGQ